MAIDDEAFRALEVLARWAGNAKKPSPRPGLGERLRSVGARTIDRLVGRAEEPEPAARIPPEPPPPPPPVVEVAAPVPVVEPAPPIPAVEPDPRRFGFDRIVLLIRGPGRAFAYWETAPERIAAPTAELRLLDANGEVVASAEVSPKVGHHAFEMPLSGEYTAALVAGSRELSRSRPARAS